MATVEAGKELLWCKKLLRDFGFSQERYMLHCDSLSAIYLMKNPMFHSKSKHIEIRHHWIRDAVERKEMQLQKVNTEDNCADMFTKPLPRSKLQGCMKSIGIKAREGGKLLAMAMISLTSLP